MSVLKKIISAVLLIATLVLTLASCDGKNDEPVQNNGKISEDFLRGSYGQKWEGSNGSLDLDGINGSFEELKTILATGGRFWYFGTQPVKYSEEISLEDFKRVKFTIEADRDVTVYLTAGQGGRNITNAKMYELKAGVPTNINLEGVDNTGVYYYVVISPTSEGVKGEFDYRTNAFKEWYQTNYKITNLEYFTK